MGFERCCFSYRFVYIRVLIIVITPATSVLYFTWWLLLGSCAKDGEVRLHSQLLMWGLFIMQELGTELKLRGSWLQTTYEGEIHDTRNGFRVSRWRRHSAHLEEKKKKNKNYFFSLLLGMMYILIGKKGTKR